MSLVETVAEKFVALTRRAGAELAATGGTRDPTLARHVYDLHVLRAHYDPAEVIALARAIMMADVEAYGNKVPAYRKDPIGETLRTARGLAMDSGFAKRYATFLRDMVYGEVQEFNIALSTIHELADRLEFRNE